MGIGVGVPSRCVPGSQLSSFPGFHRGLDAPDDPTPGPECVPAPRLGPPMGAGMTRGRSVRSGAEVPPTDHRAQPHADRDEPCWEADTGGSCVVGGNRPRLCENAPALCAPRWTSICTSVGYVAPSETLAPFGATTWLNCNALGRKSDFKRPISSFHTAWTPSGP
jgi:hypothetical protein